MIIIITLPKVRVARYLIVMRNVDVLLLQISVVVGHGRAGTHAPATVAVVIDNSAAIPPRFVSGMVAADADFR